MEGLSREQRTSAWWATLAAGGLIAHQVAGKATRDALFLSSYDVKLLPLVMMAAAGLAALAVLGLSRLLSSHPPARVLPVVTGVSTVLLLAEWGLSLSQPRLAALVVYLHMAVFGNTLVSGFWSVVNEAYDPWTARRLVGRIGTGASVGGVLGGALAWGVSGTIPVPSTLLVMAALTLTALLAVTAMPATPASQRHEEPPSSGLRLVRQTPYLISLALIVGLGAATEALLDYALSAQAKAAFASHPESLMSFFALYHTAVGLVALAIQAGLTRVALGGMGLAGTLALKPLAFTLGGVVGALAPRLTVTAVVRGIPAVLHNSLFRSSYELLYTPLAEHVKRPTKAILDVAADKAGTVLGSALALGLVALAPSFSARLVFVMAALFGLAVLGVCRGVHRGYVGALEQSLRSGAVRLDSAEVLDSTTRLTLAATNMTLERESLLAQVRALRAGDQAEAPDERPAGRPEDPLLQAVRTLRNGSPETLRRALGALPADPELVPFLIPLLERNELFLDVLHALRAAAPRATGTLIDALLDPQTPRTVRRRLPRALKACPTPRAVEGLLRGLESDELELRYECGAALSRLTARDPRLRPASATTWAAISVELEQAADATPSQQRRRLEHVFNLLSLVLEREPLRVAYWAVQSHEAIRGTALEYLENVLPERVADLLWPLLGAPAAPPRPTPPAGEDPAQALLRSSHSSLLRPRAMPVEEVDDDSEPGAGR